MDIRLTWEAVLAVIAILGFFSAVIALYVNLQFSRFADHLIEKLDKRYVQAGDCKLRAADLESRIEHLEEDKLDERA